MLAASLSLAIAATKTLAGSRALVQAFDIAGILHDNIVVVQDEVGLAVSVIAVLVVIDVVITNQAGVGVNRVRAKFNRRLRHVMTIAVERGR